MSVVLKALLRFLKLTGCFLIAAIGLCSGCQTAAYYKQAIQGQCQIVLHQESIKSLLVSTEVPASLKEKFHIILQARAFAEAELKLPARRHYLSYAELQRPFVVWNVHAAPAFSLQPKTWFYPVIGSAKYRGFFAEKDAQKYATSLRKQGFDVYVEGVEAYSTLGWFADPVLSTFIHHDPPDLAETIFHELTHQRLYISGDTDFNEALATAVAEEGLRRWMLTNGNPTAEAQYQTNLARRRQFVNLVMTTRKRLEQIYGDEPARKDRRPLGSEEAASQQAAKERVIVQLRSDYDQLKAEWGGYPGYDGWFRQPLNNAQINTVATYYHLVPAFHRILHAKGGNLETFFKEVRRLSKLPKTERTQKLQAVLWSSTPATARPVQPGLGDGRGPPGAGSET